MPFITDALLPLCPAPPAAFSPVQFCASIVLAHIVIAYKLMAYIVMAYAIMACIAIAYVVMAYIGMAYTVMADIVMPYAVLAYIVMAYSYGRVSFSVQLCAHVFLAVHTIYAHVYKRACTPVGAHVCAHCTARFCPRGFTLHVWLWPFWLCLI